MSITRKSLKSKGILVNPVCEYCHRTWITYVLERSDIGDDWYETRCEACGQIVYMKAERHQPTCGDML